MSLKGNKKKFCFNTCCLYLPVILKHSCFISRTMLDSCHSSKLGMTMERPFPDLVPAPRETKLALRYLISCPLYLLTTMSVVW